MARAGVAEVLLGILLRMLLLIVVLLLGIVLGVLRLGVLLLRVLLLGILLLVGAISEGGRRLSGGTAPAARSTAWLAARSAARAASRAATGSGGRPRMGTGLAEEDKIVVCILHPLIIILSVPRCRGELPGIQVLRDPI